MQSTDIRPCIVLDLNPVSRTGVVMVSSSDLFRPGIDFMIPKDHPDFPATGLKKTSFAMDNEIHEVPLILLEKRIGKLTGDLARAFDKWID